ncbi:hypothetical protein DY218_01430 [Streptomyces triticagri]|uniref:Uncharacterized protein n=1 Tax=Streptomyces triticagri TaxID=2293568 RepID=A0A372MC25_9ACTN|nr:hypothetical protein DY218_01430 [Streptomyces triticagri]
MSEEWLLADGRPVADVMVLSHPEQLARLRTACPQAAHTAVLAGDPCYDRLLAAASTAWTAPSNSASRAAIASPGSA